MHEMGEEVRLSSSSLALHIAPYHIILAKGRGNGVGGGECIAGREVPWVAGLQGHVGVPWMA